MCGHIRDFLSHHQNRNIRYCIRLGFVLVYIKKELTKVIYF